MFLCYAVYQQVISLYQKDKALKTPFELVRLFQDERLVDKV